MIAASLTIPPHVLARSDSPNVRLYDENAPSADDRLGYPDERRHFFWFVLRSSSDRPDMQAPSPPPSCSRAARPRSRPRLPRLRPDALIWLCSVSEG